MEIKVGDIVKCIDTGSFPTIVLNRFYLVEHTDDDAIYIGKINGTDGWFRHRFVKVNLSIQQFNKYKKLHGYK